MSNATEETATKICAFVDRLNELVKLTTREADVDVTNGVTGALFGVLCAMMHETGATESEVLAFFAEHLPHAWALATHAADIAKGTIPAPPSEPSKPN